MQNKYLIVIFIILFSLQGCFFWKKKQPNAQEPGDASSMTGLAYDATDTTFHPNMANGNKSFEPENEKRPNLVFIEGGKVLLGYEEFEMTHEKKSNYTSTVESFFMDETEIANIHWLEYLFYIRQYSEDEYMAAIPDTAVWMRQFSFNDFYVENYLRHPAFRFYPVVGVSWIQANGYCRWRSDPEAFRPVRKEFNGAYVPKSGTGKRIQINDTTWVNEGYRTPQKTAKESDKQVHKKSNRPPYRLPTEAEWIYAAQTFSYLEPYLNEKDNYKRIYPWDGNGMRNPYGKKTGYFFANFKRGRGDYAGIAGHKNDGAVYTDYIYSYPPNDVGLYNIAGNVNEWVQDIYEYIPKNLESFEFNKKITEKQDYLNKEINNFQEYLDEERYRVYKGGSWNDNAFWLSPFTRRYLTEDSSSSTIGFRCAMSAFPTKK